MDGLIWKYALVGFRYMPKARWQLTRKVPGGLWIMPGFFVLANAYNLFGLPPEDSVMVLFVVLQVIVVVGLVG